MGEQQAILVSAIITTYNYGRYVADAVQSVLAQTYPHVEVIVIDDGSTDDTQRRLQPLMDRIRYVFQQNQGVDAARNAGIALARGRYIGFLDADDMWHPRKLELQVRLMQCLPVAVVGSEVVTDLSGGWPSLPQSWPPPAEPITPEQLVIRSRFAPSTALVCRDCLAKVGGFRPDIVGVEDRDLFIRMAAVCPTLRVAWPLAYYRNHGSNLSTAAARMEAADQRMLAGVFTEVPALRGRRALRRKAESYAACMASFLYTAAGDEKRALGRICRSLLLWPFSYEANSSRSTIFRLKMACVILLRMLRLKQPHARAINPLCGQGSPEPPAATLQSTGA